MEDTLRTINISDLYLCHKECTPKLPTTNDGVITDPFMLMVTFKVAFN